MREKNFSKIAVVLLVPPPPRGRNGGVFHLKSRGRAFNGNIFRACNASSDSGRQSALVTDSLPKNPKAEKDGHFDDRLGERRLCWMVRIALVFLNKGYVVSAMDQT